MDTYYIKETAYQITAVYEGKESLEALLIRFLLEYFP